MSDYSLQFLHDKPYSFDNPSHILANAIVNGLVDRGLSKDEALRYIYSKLYRWAFDFGGLTEAIEKVGKDYANSLSKKDLSADTIKE